jgi:hypothetical protein
VTNLSLSAITRPESSDQDYHGSAMPSGLVPRALLWILMTCAIATAIAWLSEIYQPWSLDDGPMQLALFTSRVAAGLPFYRDFRVAPWLPVTYGPIAPWFASHLVPAFGGGVMGALAAGRAIMIGSLLIVCILIFGLAKTTSASTISAAIAALAFIIAPMARLQTDYRVDMLALAFNFMGLMLFELDFELLAVLPFAAAFFTKQNQLYGVAAVFLMLCATHRFRRATMVGATWLAIVGCGLAALQLAFPWFWLNTFGALAPTLDVTAPFSFLAHQIPRHLAILTLAVYALWRWPWNLAAWLFIVALGENFVSCLRWGSGPYYFLPTMAAAAILSAKSLDAIFEQIESISPSRAAQAAIAITAALIFCSGSLFVAIHGNWKLDFALMPVQYGSRTEVDQSTVNGLRAINGPIVVTHSNYLVHDQRPNVEWMEGLVLSGMKARSTFDDRALLDSIRRRQIAAFVLGPSGLDRDYRGRLVYWPELRKAIRDNYRRLPGGGDVLVMVPKARAGKP